MTASACAPLNRLQLSELIQQAKQAQQQGASVAQFITDCAERQQIQHSQLFGLLQNMGLIRDMQWCCTTTPSNAPCPHPQRGFTEELQHRAHHARQHHIDVRQFIHDFSQLHGLDKWVLHDLLMALQLSDGKNWTGCAA